MADGITAGHEAKPKPFSRPLMISARYRCDCVGREVLTETLVLDLDMPEDVFVWTMKRLRENVLAEVAQHLENAGKVS